MRLANLAKPDLSCRFNHKDTARDIVLIPGDAHHLYLRAERAGKGHGRIYTITITATDIHANRSGHRCK